MAAATPAEWVASGFLGLIPLGALVLVLAFADADAAYFDPRPVVRRAVESGCADGLLTTVANARFDARQFTAEARGSVAAVRHLAALSLRDAAISLAALLALLFPAAGGTR